MDAGTVRGQTQSRDRTLVQWGIQQATRTVRDDSRRGLFIIIDVVILKIYTSTLNPTHTTTIGYNVLSFTKISNTSCRSVAIQPASSSRFMATAAAPSFSSKAAWLA